VNLRHPVGVAAREIFVHRDDMHAVAGKAIEVDGQRRGERLALAGFHLRDPAEVQRGPAHDLDVVVALADLALRRFADRRKGLAQSATRARSLPAQGPQAP